MLNVLFRRLFGAGLAARRFVVALAFFPTLAGADSPVETPRPVPATRPQMKELLEQMKQRPFRIPYPELTEEGKQELGERASNYEARLRYHYLPTSEGSVFGGGRPRAGAAGATGAAGAPRPDFTRNADENMTLSYQFKTKLFWIVSRTNNCQYCLGHQEWKLAETGMSDDEIAALDVAWSAYNKQEQAAFAYARLLTYEPNRLSDQVIQELAEYYSPMQILEMTMSVSGNNAINRWKEGTGVPQSEGNTFARRNATQPMPGAAHSDKFTTPTSERFRNAISVVAPLADKSGSARPLGLNTRPDLESREQVRAALERAASRSPRLPLIDEPAAAEWLKQAGQHAEAANWVRLIAHFPNEARNRLPSLLARERQTGDLTALQKTQLNWILARQDRAWYAAGRAMRALQALGQSQDQIDALDGDWSSFSERDRALFAFASHLGASPIALTDEDAARALDAAGPRLVVQAINHVTSCAYFNRVTEAAGLPLEP